MTEKLSKVFARRLESLIEKNGIRKIDLARYLNVEPSTITRYTKGRVPDAETLARLADFFHVGTDYLLGLDEPNDDKTRLQALREGAGMSIDQLAEKAGLHPNLIRSYENGDDYHSGEIIIRLATALGVSASYLLGRSNDPQIKTQLPPELEQLVEEIQKGGWTADDVRVALRMLGLARGRGRGRNEP